MKVIIHRYFMKISKKAITMTAAAAVGSIAGICEMLSL